MYARFKRSKPAHKAGLRLPNRHTFLVGFYTAVGIMLVAAGIVLLAVAVVPTPGISSFAERKVDQSTKLYDRTGQVLLYDYNRDARRHLVPLANISPNAINATIAIEDSSFYNHGGIRITSIIRAVIADVMGGSLSQGGSTITQQVVKNTLLTGKKSISRKVHELVLALKLEQTYSKDQILEAYLNNIPYGGTIYGIEVAAQSYFGVPAKDLSVPQSAYLAAMIQAPTYYSPYGANRAALDARKNTVLDRMRTLGFLTESEYQTAKNTEVAFASSGQNSIIAPHFVFYILRELEEKYGTSALATGLRVVTTLDADLQVKAESIVRNYALENTTKFNASNASLVAIEPSTGHILSMVGSRDFFDTTIDGQFNAALALRQPGSTMKPFIYALALARGYTRNTVVFDVPTQFSTSCNPSDIYNNTSPCYAPQNFDEKFRGPMTFETALAQSINIPAVKVLYLVGVRNAINFATSFGLTSLGDPSQYGLTLVLGGGEVRLLDLVGAFSAFANDGVLNTPTGILQIDDAQGTTLVKYSSNPSQVVTPTIAHNISAMLSNPAARYPAYDSSSPLNFSNYDVAVKTGTTDDTRDAWVVGYTPAIAIGVWTGNNNNRPMVKSVAGYIAAPMWRAVMEYALAKYPKTYFPQAEPISTSVPPMLQGNWRIPDADGNVVPHSLLYWTDKTNPLGPPPYNPASDSQYAYWEYGVSAWYNSNPKLFSGGIMQPAPMADSVVEEGTPSEE